MIIRCIPLWAAISGGSLRKRSVVEGRSSQLCLAFPLTTLNSLCCCCCGCCFLLVLMMKTVPSQIPVKAFPRFHPGLRTSNSPGTFWNFVTRLRLVDSATTSHWQPALQKKQLLCDYAHCWGTQSQGLSTWVSALSVVLFLLQLNSYYQTLHFVLHFELWNSLYVNPSGSAPPKNPN